MPDQLAESFRQAQRELRFQLTTWAVFAAWVTGWCGANAFDARSADVTTTLGMPDWVLWGIAVPWVIAFAVTVWFATRVMQDTELVDDFASPDSTADGTDPDDLEEPGA